MLHGFQLCNDGRCYHRYLCELAKKRFEQLQGRQRGAALSRRRQEAKRIARERYLADKRIVAGR